MRAFLALFALLLATAAQAQQRQPANVSTLPATSPQEFDLLDNTGTWVSFGAVDSSTHAFIPVGGGGLPSPLPIANGGTGTGTPSGVIAGSNVTVTGAFPNQTVSAIGGGGGGGSSFYISVLAYGFAIGGADNAPAIANLMNIIPKNTNAGQGSVYFPNIQNQHYSDYYFSNSFVISRAGAFWCSGQAAGGTDASTRLVFAAGVDGVIFESGGYSPDGGYGNGSMSGCGIVSAGFWYGQTAANSNTITGIANRFFSAGAPTPVWHVGDGVMAISTWLPYQSQPAIPNGAYVSGVSGTTLTLATGFNVNAQPSEDMSGWNSIAGGGQVALLQLPAALKYTIQTTTGSSSFTVTAGPRLLKPGDILSSDAFPSGTTVITTTQAGFPQTVGVCEPFITGSCGSYTATASKTYTSGSPGQMWTMPQGFVRRTGANSDHLYLEGWGVGEDNFCSNGSTPTATGCNGAIDTNNYMVLNFIGRLIRGDNTALDHSVNEVAAHNFIVDALEDGSLGDMYTNFNGNSGEDGSSNTSIAGYCGSDQQTLFTGGYYVGVGVYNYYCGDTSKPWGFPPSHDGVGPIVIGPQSTWPLDATVVNVREIVGKMTFLPQTPASFGTPCFGVNQSTNAVFQFSQDKCETGNSWSLGWNTTVNAFDMFFSSFDAAPMRYVVSSVGGWGGTYTGYQVENPTIMFGPGVLLGNSENINYSLGTERLVDTGASAPTGSWHYQGDIRFNTAATVGNPTGWIDVANGANFVPFGVISAFNGTKTAGSCVFTIVNGVITNVTGC